MTTEVKTKTVVIEWSEKVYYRTVMDVPESWDEPEIEDAFWAQDLSNEKPVDTDFARIDFIFRTHDENVD